MDRLKSCVAGICAALLEPGDVGYCRSGRDHSPGCSPWMSPGPALPVPELLSTELPSDWWVPPIPTRMRSQTSTMYAKSTTDDAILKDNGQFETPKKLMKLVPSMPAFLDADIDASEDADPFQGCRRQISTNLQEQNVELKLTDDEEAHFEGISKQATSSAFVIFEVSSKPPAEFVLQAQQFYNAGTSEESGVEETRWSVPFSATTLAPGLYKFHFRLGGARVLSSVYPVLGGYNVAIFSDTLRRYIVGVGTSLYETPKECEELIHRRTSLNLEPPMAKKETTIIQSAHLRKVPRCASYSQGMNLMQGPNDEQAESPTPVRNNKTKERRMRGSGFSDSVFVGLYDTELSLRIQPSWHTIWAAEQAKGWGQGGASANGMQLWAGSARMGKQRGLCEDACFVSSSAVGVADGVGGMSAFASFGVNSAKLAWELMDGARSSCAIIQSEHPELPPQEQAVQAMRKTEDAALSFGASTITVAAVKDNELGVANLGDSGFMILRRGKHRLEIVNRSKEQHHRWNCPFQLTRLPPALARQFPDFACDTPDDADLYTAKIYEGDLVLLFTDGMRDNLHDHEICNVAECALPPGISQLVGLPEYKTAPENIAKALAYAAYERSNDRKAKVPFGDSCRLHGYDYEGGKEDDITVVAAWVLQDTSEGMKSPMNSNGVSGTRPRTNTL